MLDETKYPEHAKLAKVKDKSQIVGDFIKWYKAHYEIAKYVPHDDDDYLEPVHKPLTGLLAEYFGIDEDKLADEKDLMLVEIRENINNHERSESE